MPTPREGFGKTPSTGSPRTSDGVVVVDGTAVVWRDPVVQRETEGWMPDRPVPVKEEDNS
jgi:hypothetical protein